MFDVDRSDEPATLGIFGALSALIFCCAIIAVLAYTSGRNNERRNQAPAAYSESAKQSAQTHCANLDVPTAFECIYEKVESSQNQARDQQDLTAQQQSAFAALAAAFLALLTLGVTAVGVVFVKRTLAATVNAVSETGKATNEMVESNKIAKASMAGQLRAYMVVDHYYWNGNRQDGLQFGVWWKNSGATPTVKLRCYVNYVLRATPLSDDFEFPEMESRISMGHAGPNSHPFQSSAAPNIEPFLSSAIMDEIDAKRQFLYVYGWAKYFDVFDPEKEHVTRFCCMPRSTIGADDRPTFLFALHDRHNCADEGCEDC